MKVNKFNIHWQIVRVKARAIKDVDKKIEYVVGFLESHPNYHNYVRVLNWLQMTGYGYPDGSSSREFFEVTFKDLERNRMRFENQQDMDNDLSTIDTKDLQLVYNDLKKRKYGFQYKRIPRDHIDFMMNLAKELKKDETTP